jgi:hypothetical protein
VTYLEARAVDDALELLDLPHPEGLPLHRLRRAEGTRHSRHAAVTAQDSRRRDQPQRAHSGKSGYKIPATATIVPGASRGLIRRFRPPGPVYPSGRGARRLIDPGRAEG